MVVADGGGEVGERSSAFVVVGAGRDEFEEVAMTRKVVRSKRMTSVALQAPASLSRCLVSTDAFGIRVCTI